MAGKAKSTAAPPSGVLTQVPEWASTTAIAQLIGRSTRRVQQLTQDGVLSTEVPPAAGPGGTAPPEPSRIIWPGKSRKSGTNCPAARWRN